MRGVCALAFSRKTQLSSSEVRRALWHRKSLGSPKRVCPTLPLCVVAFLLAFHLEKTFLGFMFAHVM